MSSNTEMLQCFSVSLLFYAGGDVDYESANFTLMFNADDESEQVQCAQVNIIDDFLGNEKVEQFSVRFISSDVRTCSGNTDDSVCVSITDNDSK